MWRYRVGEYRIICRIVDDELVVLRRTPQNDLRARSLPDCIIAASALASKAPLATINISDFEPFLPYGLELV